MLAYLIASVILAAFVGLTSLRSTARLFAMLFYGLQAVFCLWILTVVPGQISSLFFTFDKLGTLFFVLMALVSPVAFYQSDLYLDRESPREYKLYHMSLILLCASASAVYFSNNLAVTWIFLEATTLAAAGLVYHRRTGRSLEATWKYLFVCSTGIAMAYLGILLFSTAAQGGDISYASLARTLSAGNPLYLKIAFLFMLVGYSCKMELFPLYTIGVDANSAAPTPASAVLSTVLVNAGFVSIYRIYGLIAQTPVFAWASQVLILAGVISMLIGAVYIRRTNNYKRLLAYSTVENMGIVAIGLGIGGMGVFAAVFHMIAHTLIKSGMFFHIAQVGRLYGTYRINRLGNYLRVNPLGAVSMLIGLISLLAFPPSAFFISEILILKQIIAERMWWLLAVVVLLVCVVMYSLCYRILTLCYRSSGGIVREEPVSRAMTWTGFTLIALSAVLGIVQPVFLVDFIHAITTF